MFKNIFCIFDQSCFQTDTATDVAVTKGLFPALSGRFDENSTCGLNNKCKEVKARVQTVCVPLKASNLWLYNSCRDYVQLNSDISSPEEYVCKVVGPQEAFAKYNRICPGFDPNTMSAEGIAHFSTQEERVAAESAKNRNLMILYGMLSIILLALIYYILRK